MIGNIVFASMIVVSMVLMWVDMTGTDRRELLESLDGDSGDIGPALAYIKASGPQLAFSAVVLVSAIVLKVKGVL